MHRGKSVNHLTLSVNQALLFDELSIFVYGRSNLWYILSLISCIFMNYFKG